MKGVYPDNSAVSELIGVLLIILLLVALAGVVYIIAQPQTGLTEIPMVRFDLSDTDGDPAIMHAQGDALDMNRTVIKVNGVDHTRDFRGTSEIWSNGEILTLEKDFLGGHQISEIQVIYHCDDGTDFLLYDHEFEVPVERFYDLRLRYPSGTSTSSMKAGCLKKGGRLTLAVDGPGSYIQISGEPQRDLAEGSVIRILLNRDLSDNLFIDLRPGQKIGTLRLDGVTLTIGDEVTENAEITNADLRDFRVLRSTLTLDIPPADGVVDLSIKGEPPLEIHGMESSGILIENPEQSTDGTLFIVFKEGRVRDVICGATGYSVTA